MQTTCEGIRRSAGLEALALALALASGGWLAGRTTPVVDCVHGKVARNGTVRWQNWVKPIREGTSAMAGRQAGRTRAGQQGWWAGGLVGGRPIKVGSRPREEAARPESPLMLILSELGPRTLDLGPHCGLQSWRVRKKGGNLEFHAAPALVAFRAASQAAI